MHAGHARGLDHGGVAGGGVKAGDIVADRPGQQAHGLRQIADLAAQLHRIPLVGGGPVQSDFPFVGGHRPHQQPGQCGFARGGIADHPQPVAGGQGETDVGQNLWRLAPRTRSAGPGQPGHGDLSAGVWQGDGGGLAALGGKERAQPLMRRLRLAQSPPLPDQLIHRPQSPARQHRGGDDHPARDFAQDHQIGPQRQDPRLQQHPEGPAGGGQHFGRIAALLPPGQCGPVQALPAGGQGGGHAHRQNRLGIAVAFVGKIPLCLVQMGGAGHRTAGQHPVGDGNQAGDTGPRHRDPAQPGVNDEQHAQIQRHKRQIKQRRDGRPRQKAAHHIKIAQGLRALGFAPRNACADPGIKGHAAGVLVQCQRPARQQPGAQKVVKSQKAVQHDDNAKQAQQGGHRSAGQHPVIDLQHIDRPGQHQHIQHRAKAQHSHQHRRQPAQRRTVAVGLPIWSCPIWSCPIWPQPIWPQPICLVHPVAPSNAVRPGQLCACCPGRDGISAETILSVNDHCCRDVAPSRR